MHHMQKWLRYISVHNLKTTKFEKEIFLQDDDEQKSSKTEKFS